MFRIAVEIPHESVAENDLLSFTHLEKLFPLSSDEVAVTEENVTFQYTRFIRVGE